MSQDKLAEIAAELAAEYPGGDKADNARQFQSVVATVLPHLAHRASLAIGRGIENITESWRLIRGDSEELFEEALAKADRVKVIFVASKFINNKLIGEMMTRQALEIAKQQKED